MKRPSFQFYPADWRKDSALQSCSIAARGLWIEMMCIMHECEPYGYLSINGHAMNAAQLARLVGESEKAIKGLLGELENAGVFSRTETGCIYSRRMVNDERIRTVRAESGKLGGNPDLLKQKPGKEDNLLKQKDKQKSTKATEDDQAKANQSFKQKPTPSSSSSSSSSTSVNSLKAPNGALRERACASRAALCELKRPDWLPEDAWRDWVSYRKTHKSRFTEKAAELSLCELAKLRERGFEPRAVIEQSILSGWTGLFPLKDRAGTGPPGLNRQVALETRNAQVGAQWLAEMKQQEEANAPGGR
ncbi:hypothetical protein CAGGBEG34_330012 [Candidatus Glomeribacter gigasporarum BEG34]|uniref:Uncharacterized protein n=1 Tax=Candidatus Glomeribacter gigasporarum BEG34 TaxID=1070319 RepID=G2JAW5_9BURK|nr:hypothetical protein [Candidatus Glomeribacter gigasporarum]CCD29917.1 hypothetical protein CAGGBEG34_330012 [Candidatus Glomeribacter gigasporarum BEG34]